MCPSSFLNKQTVMIFLLFIPLYLTSLLGKSFYIYLICYSKSLVFLTYAAINDYYNVVCVSGNLLMSQKVPSNDRAPFLDLDLKIEQINRSHPNRNINNKNDKYL